MFVSYRSNSFTFICTYLTLPVTSHFNQAQDLSSSDAVVQDLESMENVKEKEIPSSRELRTCDYWATENHKCNQYERCTTDGYCVVRRKYRDNYPYSYDESYYSSYDGSGKKSELSHTHECTLK